MKKLRLKEPEVIELDNSVVVKIFHEPLVSPEEIVIGYLDNHEEISNAIARDLCGINSENKMKKVFQKLQLYKLLCLTKYATQTFTKSNRRARRKKHFLYAFWKCSYERLYGSKNDARY